MDGGGALAFVAGIFYLIFIFFMGWESGWAWVILAVIFSAGTVAALTMLIPPKSLWFYPLMFSLVTLLVGLLVLVSADQPRPVVEAWLSIGSATFAVSFCGGYVVQVISRRRTRILKSDEN